ncbi:transposase [Ferruginibacter sp.]|nr:transposase [Ferruginibacter sp.]
METFQRKSQTALHKIYFWTATIHNWLPLLETDNNKQIIIDSIKYLSDKHLITVYAFVIMPNHIHLIWQQNELNGKETAKGSLLKYSAHLFLNQLQAEGRSNLYEVNAANKKHEIWQRDALGIEIYSRAVAKQKLDYIHFNPVSGKWQLAKDDISYKYSSAKFYETGIDEFGFLNDIYTVFDGE